MKLKQHIIESSISLKHHSELNPKIWKDEDAIIPEVKKKLLENAEAFLIFTEISKDKLLDRPYSN